MGNLEFLKSKPALAKILIVFVGILVLIAVGFVIWKHLYIRQANVSEMNCPEGDFACESGLYSADKKDIPTNIKPEVEGNYADVAVPDTANMSEHDAMYSVHPVYGDKINKKRPKNIKKENKIKQLIIRFYF